MKNYMEKHIAKVDLLYVTNGNIYIRMQMCPLDMELLSMVGHIFGRQK